MKALYFFVALSSFSLVANDLTSYHLWLEQDKFRHLQQQLQQSSQLPQKELWLLQLKTMLGLRQSEQAEQLASQALQQYPHDAELLRLAALNQFNLAQDSSIFSAASYARTGLALLKRAMAVAPADLATQQTLISFYLQAPAIAGGDSKEARRLAKAMAEQHQPEGTLASIEVLLHDKQLSQAIQLAEQQLQQYPQHPALLGAYANLLSLNQDPLNAFIQYQKAAAAATDLSEQQSYYYQLGRLAATAQQNPELGQQALQYYLAFYQDSDHPRINWARLRLAQIYLAQKQQHKAQELLQQIQNQQQDDDKLKNELKKLEKQLKKA
jgi:protein involved in temperature-dependent protein secretion